MLKPHRRHVKNCPHAGKGWNYTLCDCPIWCDGVLNGRRFRRSLDTSNWDRALRRISRLERGDDQDFLESSVQTVASAVKAYLEDAEVRNLKPSSLNSYTNTLTQFADFLGPLPIAALTVAHVAGFRARQVLKPGSKDVLEGLAPRTQRKEIEHLRAFGAFCVTRGLRPDNPAKLLRPALVEDVATLPYTDEEIGKLLDACERMQGMWKSDAPVVRRRARALVLALLYSGLRVGDVARLRRAALESSGHLVLRTTKTGVPLKVLLHPDAIKALSGLPAPAGNPTYFFWSGRGRVENCAKSLWRTVARIGKLAGVHAHPHRFRDTFAVELLTGGADIRTVQKLLGHDSVRTTERHYAHFVLAHQRILDEAAARLDFTPKGKPVLVEKKRQN